MLMEFFENSAKKLFKPLNWFNIPIGYKMPAKNCATDLNVSADYQ